MVVCSSAITVCPPYSGASWPLPPLRLWMLKIIAQKPAETARYSTRIYFMTGSLFLERGPPQYGLANLYVCYHLIETPRVEAQGGSG